MALPSPSFKLFIDQAEWNLFHSFKFNRDKTAFCENKIRGTLWLIRPDEPPVE
jgi:hypothetical protein